MKASRGIRVGALGVLLAGAALAFYRFGRPPIGDPESAVPRDSFLVAKVDVERLRRSPLATVLFGDDKSPKDAATSRALGLGGLAKACGFEPITRVQTLVLAVPEEGERGDFGVAAKIEVSPEELEACTKGLAHEHEGKAEAERQGPFLVMSDKGGRRIGYGDGGLLLVGKGSWFDQMIGAAQRKAPSLKDATDHVAVRTALLRGNEWGAPALVVTAALPKALRERLKREMDGESGDASSVMAGVLGVTTAGLAVRAGGASDLVEVRGELTCESTEAAATVTKLLQKLKFDWSKDLPFRMIGLGPLFDSISIEQEGVRVHASASMNGEALSTSLSRALRFRSRPMGLPGVLDDEPPRPATDPPPGPALGSRDGGLPGERVTAPRDGGAPTRRGDGGPDERDH